MHSARRLFLLSCLLPVLATLGPRPLAAAPDLYREPYRPQFHFSPERNWMNDPNGLMYFDGEFHLFYQYNPFGDKWGHMSWAHAVSPDLVHWAPLPLALPEKDGVMAFSGSAVVDTGNSSGFGDGRTPPLVAIYTGHIPSPTHQAQYLAYSNDRGRTWTTYPGNPVLDRGLADFRDPKVFWYAADRCWIMAVALPPEHKVAFYRSANLREWTLLSEFGPAGATVGVWECPDLFPLPVPGEPAATKWVLIVNVGEQADNAGSGCQYFLGEFDGRRFIPDSGETRWVDRGRDFYAAVSWADVPASDGRRLWLGWASNWRYASEMPTAPWRGDLSLVRELTLVRGPQGLALAQRPVPEYLQLRGRPHVLAERALAGSVPLDAATFGTGSWELKLVLEPGAAGEAGLLLTSGAGAETRVGYDAARQVLFVDRTQSGPAIHPDFLGRHETPCPLASGRLALQVFFDQSLLEIFADDGRVVFTERIFAPPGQAPAAALYARGGGARLVALQAWPLRSAWSGAAATPARAAGR